MKSIEIFLKFFTLENNPIIKVLSILLIKTYLKPKPKIKQS